jgi:hypothetical protein
MILVLDADADTVRAVANAAICVNCNLRFIQTSKDFFCFCHKDFQNVAAIILDVDPGGDPGMPWTHAKKPAYYRFALTLWR